MESEHCEDEANNQHIVQPKLLKNLSNYTTRTLHHSRMPDGRITVYYGRIKCDEEYLLETEQFVERMNFLTCNIDIWEMMTGKRMLDETNMERDLEQMCFSLFVTKHGKGMVLMLLCGPYCPHNPLVWAMKTYPNSENIQLYGIWMMINAMYWSQSAPPIVANQECIQVILTAMRAFPTEDFFEDGVMAIENIIDINPDNANHLVNELENDLDFISEVVMNNGTNLLLHLMADLWNSIILQLVLKYSKQ